MAAARTADTTTMDTTTTTTNALHGGARAALAHPAPAWLGALIVFGLVLGCTLPMVAMRIRAIRAEAAEALALDRQRTADTLTELLDAVCAPTTTTTTTEPRRAWCGHDGLRCCEYGADR